MKTLCINFGKTDWYAKFATNRDGNTGMKVRVVECDVIGVCIENGGDEVPTVSGNINLKTQTRVSGGKKRSYVNVAISHWRARGGFIYSGLTVSSRKSCCGTRSNDLGA